MLLSLPFLMSANDAGVIGLLLFLGSSVVLGIPVFANRGQSQLMWAGVVSLVLLIELALIVTFVVLIAQGEIHPSIS
jgi:hypothetical protein